MPFSSMRSPSQTTSMAPALKASTMTIPLNHAGSAGGVFHGIELAAAQQEVVAHTPAAIARPTVVYRVILLIFFRPSAPSFAIRSRAGNSNGKQLNDNGRRNIGVIRPEQRGSPRQRRHRSACSGNPAGCPGCCPASACSAAGIQKRHGNGAAKPEDYEDQQGKQELLAEILNFPCVS